MASAFDAAAFGVSPPEAALMDPQQRLLLEAAAEVMHGRGGAAALGATSSGSGVKPATAAAAAAVGAWVGVSSMDYNKLSVKFTGGVTQFTSTGASLSVTAGRLSYSFNLRGPAVAVDTACSSSLVAAHSAAAALTLGSCRAALMAGANLTLSPDTPAAFAKAGMLAPDGRCKTLDAAADGYVRAEAVGVMVLQALRSGGDSSSAPLALLAGSAVNQDGRSSGLTAPNGPAQQEVVRSALAAAGLSAADVSTLQLHGTGTGLGDPIEVGALAAVFAGSRSTPLTLTTSKSSLGHAEPAAGVVGMLHAAHTAAHAAAPPLLHLTTLNPFVAGALSADQSADSSKWRLPRQPAGSLLPSAGHQAVSGVSSFAFQVGFRLLKVGCFGTLAVFQLPIPSHSSHSNQTQHQGTNAHLLLETPSAAGRAPAAATLDWQRSRHWFMAAVSPLLSSADCPVRPLASDPIVRFTSLLGAQGTSHLLTATAGGAVILPAAAAMMISAAAVDALAGSSSPDGRVLLADIQMGGQAVPTALHAAVELAVTVDRAACSVSVAFAELMAQGGHGGGAGGLLQAFLCRLDAPTVSAATPSGTPPLPAWLSALLQSSLDRYGLLPSQPCKAQVARRGGGGANPAFTLEPSVAAACQLEASLALPLVAGGAPIGLPSSIEACVLAPRGQDAANGLDLVDPDAPDAVPGQTQLQPVRRSSFWLSSAASGAFSAQVRGVAFRPLSEAVALPPPLAAAAAAATAAATPEAEEADGQLLYAVVWEAEEAVSDEEVEEMQPQGAAASLSIQPGKVGCPAPQRVIAAVQQAGKSAVPLHLATAGGASLAAAALGHGTRNPAAAMAWAAVRSAAIEQPSWQLSALDADSSRSGCGDRRLSLAAGRHQQPGRPSTLYGQAVGGRTLYTARLARHSSAAASQPAAAAAAPLPRQGTYIITGGSGFVGAQVARWLLQVARVQHVHLISRSGQLPAALSDLVQQTSDGSGSLTASMGDTACSASAAAVAAAPHLPPVIGLFHAAGVLADGLVDGMSAAAVRSVVAPKAAGLSAVTAALHGQPLATTVLFSSVAALLGSPGQANYAAANAALDAAASSLQASGVSAVSVQWGAWAGAGMAASDPQTAARVARLGMGLISPASGLAALEGALSAAASSLQSKAVVAAVPFNWQSLADRLPRPASSLFSAFIAPGSPAAAAIGRPVPASSGAAAVVTTNDSSEDADQLTQRVERAVEDSITLVLGQSAAADAPLMAAGLDSLGAVELRNALEARLQLQLPPTFVFDAPTPAAMVAAIKAQLLPAGRHEQRAAAGAAALLPPLGPPGSALVSSSAALAVTGFVSRTAAGGAAPEAVLLGGSDPVGVVPLDRWNVESAAVRALAGR